MKKEFFLLCILFFVSAFLILFKHNSIPNNLSFDEVAFARLALSLDGKPYTPYSVQATGHSTLYFYLLLASLKIFGTNTFALRLPSAIFGIINPLVIFFLIKQLFEKRSVAFFTALTFATLRWHYNFARFSFEATFLIFIELISLYFLLSWILSTKKAGVATGGGLRQSATANWLRALAGTKERQNLLKMIFSAFFAGLAFHSYTPGRLFFLLPLIYLFIKKQYKALGLFTITFLLVTAPLLTYFSTHPDVRASDLSIIADQTLTFGQKASQVLQNLQKNLLMFVGPGDMNGRHNFPGKAAVDPILLIVFLVGLASSYYSKKRRATNFFFIALMVLALIPTILTPLSDNPNMLRTITILVPLTYFIAAGFVFLEKKLTLPYHWLMFMISLVIFLHAALEARTYFLFQSRVARNAFEVTCPLEKSVKFAPENIPTQCRVRRNLF